MSPSKVDVRPTYRIASIPADGIGPEVIEAGVTVLKKFAETLDTFDLDFTNFDWSSDYYKKHGRYLPENALETLKKYDAILFGAVGAPGMFTVVISFFLEEVSDTSINRCTRPHLTVAASLGYLPTPSTICKC